jgi:hypothetical protein
LTCSTRSSVGTFKPGSLPDVPLLIHTYL